MISIPEIIERTFYISVLHETLKRGLTLNPDDYLVMKEGYEFPVPTEESEIKFKQDKDAIGDKFIYVFGIGNNQVRGPKTLPRITLELKAFYPGDIGVEKEDYEETEDGLFQAIEHDYETKHTLIDVHLCSNTEADMRVLHNIMYTALPARGYIKPYLNDYDTWKSTGINTTGNIYIEVGNYYDHPDLGHGFLEKVYTYEVRDGLLMENPHEGLISPILDISCLIQPEGTDGILLQVPNP